MARWVDHAFPISSLLNYSLSHRSDGLLVMVQLCQLHNALCTPEHWDRLDGTGAQYAVSVHATKFLCQSNLNWRCMEHLLHLAVKHFVQTIAPHSHKKCGAACDEYKSNSASDGNDNNDNDNDDHAVDVGNSLGKAIALVKQIQKSPQARAFFCAMCCQVKIKPLELLLWIWTCWGSLFTFLEQFINLKAVHELLLSTISHLYNFLPAVTQFTILADESNAVPSLTNQWSYSDFHLTQRDWELLVDIRDVLRVSGMNHITSLLTTSPLGAIKYPADVLKWACAHCVAHYSQLRVPYQALEKHGYSSRIPCSEGCTLWRCQEPSQMVWPCWEHISRVFYLP